MEAIDFNIMKYFSKKYMTSLGYATVVAGTNQVDGNVNLMYYKGIYILLCNSNWTE